MIISNKKRFIFVHNPKAAGTSIRDTLSTYKDDERQFWHQGWFPSENRVIDLAHLTADQWYPIVDKTYTTFGFVRDPYERFISGYREMMRRHSADFPQLSDVSKTTARDLRTILTPANLRWDWRFIHLCPQHYFFYEGTKCRMDKIGRMETLQEDWAAITSLVGIQAELPHSRQAPEDDYQSLLENDDIVELINSLYLRDFQLFGYHLSSDVVTALTHSERIAAIHDPARISFFTAKDLDEINFSAGERAALLNRAL